MRFMNLLTAVALGAVLIFAFMNASHNVPTIVRDLALEREVRDLESELRDLQAWNRTCWDVVEKYSSQLKECRQECHSVEVGS